MGKNFEWCGLPEVCRCTGTDENGAYNRIDGFLYERDGGLQFIAKVYVKKDGENNIEFIDNRFSSDSEVLKIIQEVIEMQDRAANILGRKVKTNSNTKMVEKYHLKNGTIDDYSEEKEKTRSRHNGDVILSGKTIKYYFIVFDDSKTQNGARNGLWLTEEYFNFVD